MFRTDGGYNVPGMPGNGAAVRFNPADLNFQPGPGYFANPNYSPFLQDQDRDRFILHDPRSGVAGGPSFDINRTPGSLGGRSGEQLRRLYEGGTQQNEKLNEELRRRGIMPGAGPQLPLAYGSSNLPGAIGNMGGIQNAQFFGGPQLGQMPAGFQGKYVS